MSSAATYFRTRYLEGRRNELELQDYAKVLRLMRSKTLYEMNSDSIIMEDVLRRAEEIVSKTIADKSYAEFYKWLHSDSVNFMKFMSDINSVHDHDKNDNL